MRFGRPFIAALVCFGAAFAQTPEDRLRSKINSGAVPLLSGPPLLAHVVAVKSAEVFESIQGETNLEVTYHFALVDATGVPTSMIVQRGNAFERAVLRMFGRKTEKVVLAYRCQQGRSSGERSQDGRCDRRNLDLWEDSLCSDRGCDGRGQKLTEMPE